MSVYAEEENVIIHIKDNGEGMDADVLHRLGEPYFTKKNKGTGLGLMVTFRIIEAMQGKVKFTSKKEWEPNPSPYCHWQKLRMILTP